jgi:hypothetical protein
MGARSKNTQFVSQRNIGAPIEVYGNPRWFSEDPKLKAPLTKENI